MTSLSASPLHVAMIQVAGSLPMFFLALPAGAMADIIDRRKYLLGVQLWMAVVAVVLSVLTLSGMMNVFLLVTLTLCLGVGTALMMPAWTALTPELVDKKDLSSAIALSSVGINIARAIGPAIAGILVSMVGPWLTFALNAVSFFAVMAVLFFWKRQPESSVLPAERFFGAVRAGWRYTRSTPPLQAVLWHTLAFFIFASAGMSLLPLIVRSELQGTAMDYGLLLGSVGLGAILGAVGLPALRQRVSRDWLVGGASALYALTIYGLAVIGHIYALVPVMLISGMAWITVLSTLQLSAQTTVPAWVRARALSVYVLVYFGGMAVGGLLWGTVASHSSIPLALLIAGSGLLISTLLAWRVTLPVTDTEELTPSMHWPSPVLSEEEDNTEERGPVMVTVEYDITPEQEKGFQTDMRELEKVRRRNGAISWGLVQDSANPRRWLEFFFDESWVAHLRHHRRVTRGELKIEAQVRRHQTPGTDIRINHYLKGSTPPASTDPT